MNSRAQSILALALLLSSGSSSGQKIVAEFRPDVPPAEAIWMLRSYADPFVYHRSRHPKLLLSGSDTEELTKAESTIRSELDVQVDTDSDHLPSQSNIDKHNLTLQLKDVREVPLALREKISVQIPKSVRISWVVDSAYAVLSPTRKDVLDRLVRWLTTERIVQHAYVAQIPSASAAKSVDALGTVQLGATSPSKTNPHGVLHKPSEGSIYAEVLPTESMISAAVQYVMGSKGPLISLEQADSDDQGAFFVVDVSHVRGRITSEGYWERYRFDIPIYVASKNELKVRCILSGAFASGIGNMEPGLSAFQSLEPQYSSELQSKAQEIITYLTLEMKKARSPR